VLPAFRGPRAFDDAIEAGSARSGATVHRLRAAVDRGEVLERAALRLDPDSSRDALETQLHALEHEVVERAIRTWATQQAASQR
jgi:phosphoribosylglycinamide formyltransferase 1